MKQKKIKIEPRIKLNYGAYAWKKPLLLSVIWYSYRKLQFDFHWLNPIAKSDGHKGK